MNKIIPLLAFSALLLVPLVTHDAFATNIFVENNVLVEDTPPDNSNVICTAGPAICADDFVLTSSSTVTDLHFWTIEESGATFHFDDQVTYTIYNDNAGMPGSIASGPTIVTTSSVPYLGNPNCIGGLFVCYEVWLDIVPGITLSAGTYWIGIENPGTFSGDGWTVWMDSDDLSGSAISLDGGSNWIGSSYDFPIVITGFIVGGSIIPIDFTSLILASAQSFSWMIPVTLSVLGIGLFVFRKSENA